MEPIPSPQSPHDRPLAQSRSSAPTGDAITQSAALALSAPMALLAVVRDGHMDVAASAGPVPAAGPWLDALYAAVALHHGPLAVDSIDAAPRTDGAPATSCVAVALRDEAGAACGLLAVLYEGPGRPGRPGGLQTLDALAHVAADALGLIPERATGEAALSEGDGLLQSLDGFLPGLSVPRETERETALYRAFYEAVLEQSPTQIIVVDREGRYVHLNPAYEPDPEIRAWLIGKTVLDYGRRTGLDESIGREIRAAEDDVVQTGRACTLELELPGPDGPRYVDRLAGPVYDHTGRVSHVVWHSVDVTERRRAERALRESEERFRHLAEATPSGLVVTDEAGRITFVNRETEQLFGYAREELDGQSVEILLPEADRREHVAQRAAFADNPNPRHLGTGREVFGRRKDGSLVPIEVGLAPFETAGRTAVLATVVDLTARRAAEAALRRSEERLAAVVEGLDEGLIIADHDGNVLQWNRTALAQHGFATLEEGRRALPEFRDLFEVRPPGGEVLPFEQWPLPRIFAGETLNGVVLQLRRVGAEWGPTFRYGGATVSDAEGRLIAFITVVDVTEQEAAAAALQARAAELQAITDHTEDAILRYDRDLRYLFANPAIEQVTGVAPAALIGKTYVEAGLPPEVAEQRARELREVFDTGRPVSYEVAFPGPHGPRAYTVRAVPEQRGPDGRVETIVVVVHDVTEERAATAALTVQTAELQAITDHAEDVILRVDRDLRYLFANPATLHVLGVPPEAFIGKTYTELGLDPEAAEGRARYLRGVFETGEPATYDLEFTLANGENRIVHSHAVPERRDADGRVETLLVFGRDVTEQRAAEAAVRAKAAELQAITDHADDLILRFDRDLRYLFANPATLHVLGVPPEALIGRTDAELARDPALAAEREVYLRRVFETGEPAAYEVDVPLTDGGRLVLHLHALPERRGAGGRVETVLVIARDVTAQRTADDALRARAAELQAITTYTEDLIARHDRALCHLYVNPTLEQFTGLPAAHFLGKTNTELGMPAGHAAAYEAALRGVFETGEPADFPFDAPRADGAQGHFVTRLVPETRDAGGRVETVLTVTRDFTALHAANRAVRARAAELQSITDHTDDVIARLDRDLRYVFVNPAIERLTGHPPEVFIGKTLLELTPDPASVAEWIGHLEGALLSGEPGDVTMEREQAGRRQYLHTRIVPEFGPGGAVETLLVVTHDVTEQRTAADALRESEERFREVVESAPGGIVVSDLAGRITLVNRRAEALFGYTRGELVGGPVERLALAGVATGDAPAGAGADLYARRKDGSTFPVEVALTPIETESGPAVLTTVIDITQRKAAEAALRASEERMRGVLEATPDAFFAVDSDWRFTYVNPHAEALWGVAPGALLGNGLPESFRGITTTPFYRAYTRVMQTRLPVVVTGQASADGKWFEAHAFPYETGLAVFFSDVTARKTAEAALVRKEAEMRRLGMVAARTTNGVLIADAEGQIEWVNEGFTRMSGYAPDEVVGQPLGDVLRGPGTDPDRAALLQGHLILGEGFTAEVVNYRKDGTPYWVHLDAQPLRDAAGRLTGFIRIDTDVTARKRAEDALRENERRFRLATESARVGVFELDLATRAFHWSAHTRTLFGRPEDSEPLTLAQFLGLVHPDDRESVARLITAAIRPAAAQRIEGECRVVWPDGSVRWLSLRGDVVHEGTGDERRPARLMGVALDVTEQKQYEDELVAAREQAEEAARLKASLLANMSHEIRTPLTGIIGFAEILAEEVTGEAAEFAGLIRRSGQRLLETLNSVLDLARIEADKLSLLPERQDLHAAAADAAALYGPRAEEHGLRLVVDAPDPVPVWADEGALARVLANLLSNAVKFTSRGEILLRVSAEGEHGVVRVSDTGAGIDPAFIPHLFEEFEQESWGLARNFEGAGLGLTLTKRLVELMGGTIGVESEKGVGSTFTVRLPLAQTQP